MIEETDIVPEHLKSLMILMYPQSILVDSKNFLNNKKFGLFNLCYVKTGYIGQITLFPLISQALKLETLASVTSYQLPME